jgi:hypothetical protein
MHRTLFVGAALALLFAAPAHAGRKKKDLPPKNEEPVEAPADIAADEGMSIGRPAGMDFLDLPCPYVAGTTHVWTLATDGKRGKSSGTQELVIVANDPSTITFDVGGHVQIETDDEIMKQLLAKVEGLDVKPRIQYFNESMSMNLANQQELMPLYTTVADEMATIMKEKGLPDQAIASVRQMLTNPAMVEGITTKDLYPLFNFTCGSFPTADTEYQTEVQSPMGMMVPAMGTMKMERPGPDRVRFVNVEKVPLDALVPAILKLTGGAAGTPEAEAELRKALEEMDGQITTSLTVDVNVASGAITHLKSEQLIKVPGAEQSNTRELTAVAE